MFVLDPDGTILALNAKAAQIFGYSQQELKGCSVAVPLPPALSEQIRSFPLSAGKNARQPGMHGVHKDGCESQAREICPDAVRILLTGQTDI